MVGTTPTDRPEARARQERHHQLSEIPARAAPRSRVFERLRTDPRRRHRARGRRDAVHAGRVGPLRAQHRAQRDDQLLAEDGQAREELQRRADLGPVNSYP